MMGDASNDLDPSLVLKTLKENDDSEYQRRRAHNRKQYAKRVAKDNLPRLYRKLMRR